MLKLVKFLFVLPFVLLFAVLAIAMLAGFAVGAGKIGLLLVIIAGVLYLAFGDGGNK